MTLGSRLRGHSNASETSSGSGGSRLIPANDPDQNASGGILMNGTSGDKKALKAQEGPRRCSFKEPLPVRPDKHDLNRRSSITMGVAARASLLSSQNSNNSSFAAVPDGYNPDPEHMYSPADIIPGLKKAWKRMSSSKSHSASQVDKQREGQDLAQRHMDSNSKANANSASLPEVFDDDSSSEHSNTDSLASPASTAATSTDLKDTEIREEDDEEEDEGMATPRGHHSRRASFDQSRHDELKHRLYPSSQVLGFDTVHRSPSASFDHHDSRTPTRSPSASPALSRKASTGAPSTNDDADAAPPLQKRRTQTEHEDDVFDDNLHAKASDKEKKCMGRFCV